MAVNNISAYNSAVDGMALPLSITRGNPNPLDDTYLYDSYANAAAYAATSPVAYVGQIIGVVEHKTKADSTEYDSVGAYIIVDTNGTLVELKSTESSGDSALDLSQVKSQIAALQGIVGADTLSTTSTTIIGAINELKTSSSGTGSGKLELKIKSTPNTGMQKTYILEQNGTSIGEIDIPITSSSSGSGDSSIEWAEINDIKSIYTAHFAGLGWEYNS